MTAAETPAPSPRSAASTGGPAGCNHGGEVESGLPSGQPHGNGEGLPTVDAHGDARTAFAPILEGCRPLFPPELLGSGGWERLLDRAKRLPRSVLDAHFGFEFRLGEPSPEADLFVAIRPGSDLSRHYVREGARAEPGSPAATLAAGLREQAEKPDSYLARAVSGVVLEYDLAGLAPHRPPPPPGIFLSPRRSAPGSRDGFFEHRDPAALLAALAVTVGWNGHEEMLGAVERILAALPERGYVFHAGALPARSPRALRILLKGIAKEEVPVLLEQVEWPGPTAAAAGVLASMDDLVAYVAVSLDVTARGPGPRLGLELYRAPKWFAADRRGWRPFIARLVECGWCLPAKAEGLRRWPGTEKLFGDGEAHHVRQGINHVKVVVERGVRTEAKAYVGMGVRPYESTA